MSAAFFRCLQRGLHTEIAAIYNRSLKSGVIQRYYYYYYKHREIRQTSVKTNPRPSRVCAITHVHVKATLSGRTPTTKQQQQQENRRKFKEGGRCAVARRPALSTRPMEERREKPWRGNRCACVTQSRDAPRAATAAFQVQGQRANKIRRPPPRTEKELCQRG